MGGVHQADDGVVDMAVEIHRLDQLGLAADDAWEDRRLMIGLHRFARVRRHPEEDDALALAHRIGPYGRQGRGAVGTDVAHGIDRARARATDQHRLVHHLMALQAGDRHVARQGHEIPGIAHKALAEGDRRRFRFRRGGSGGRDGIGGDWLHPASLSRDVAHVVGVDDESQKELYITK